MKLTYSSSLVLTLTSVISAANLPACSSQPYKAATLLSSYAPAQSFCTKNFLLPRATTTFTAALATLTSMAAAETQVVTVAVAVSTATDSTVTSVITQTVASTSIGTLATDIVWITETEARRRRKRAATTIVNSALASLWSSLSSRGSATLSTLCACIGTPATSTVTFTPKTTVALTPTIYKTTTLVSIVTMVPTLTSTSTFVEIVFETAYNTVTLTTTITPTATATSPAARECEALSAANQGYFHGFKLACNNEDAAGIDLFGVPASTFSECLDICAGISECKGITFVGIVPGHPDHMCYGKAGTGLEENTNFDSAYIEEV